MALNRSMRCQTKPMLTREQLSPAYSSDGGTCVPLDAESADIYALDADDFTDVTLAKVTLLM